MFRSKVATLSYMEQLPQVSSGEWMKLTVGSKDNKNP